MVLSLTIRAQVDEAYLGFLVEVQQAGIFYIKNADPAQLSQVLGIACPNTLFPYARESVDSLVVKGGFPPIQLAQVNFEALYVKAMQERQQKSQEGGANEPRIKNAVVVASLTPSFIERDGNGLRG